MTDPIADMLTRIRNAVIAKHTRVDMPASRIKTDIARILQDEGYIQGFKVLDEPVAGKPAQGGTNPREHVGDWIGHISSQIPVNREQSTVSVHQSAVGVWVHGITGRQLTAWGAP